MSSTNDVTLEGKGGVLAIVRACDVGGG